jgi:Mg2+-importing ATPase
MIKIKSTVLRNGIIEDIPIEDIVPGDIVILNSGDKIPADCKILESKDLFINEDFSKFIDVIESKPILI